MKNTNNKSGSVSAVTTKETNLKFFSIKDAAKVSIEAIEMLLDKEKGPVRPYSDEDIKNRAKDFLSKDYQSNSFEMKIDRKNGIVWAVPTSNKNQEECAYGEVVERAIQNSLWIFSPSKNWKYSYSIVTPNENLDGSILIADKLDHAVAEHICKTHNDWRNFKMKNGEKKVIKNSLRRMQRLAWKMKTFRTAFQLIQKNNYLGFDSIKEWIKKNENDVNYWIFTKWLMNSSNYEEWIWYFWNNHDFRNKMSENQYSEIWSKCQDINYFQFGKHISTTGIPEGEWNSYDYHKEYESKLFTDRKAYTASLILEKMFEFAEDYVKETGWITGEMAEKYGIDLKLVEINSSSDVLLNKMDPETANRVRKIVENTETEVIVDKIMKECQDKYFEENPDHLEKSWPKFYSSIEKRVDNLEKMIKDIWTDVCADKSPVIINKKPVLEGQNCPHCRNSKDGCEFYDKGTCRGICYPTYPPQYDPCVFEK